jgi:hypothetical protein
VRLSWSPTLASPVAMIGGEVCVPRRALVALDANAVEGMLAHELAHVVRRDPEWLAGFHLLSALLFFQPLNRLALRRLRESAEYLSDDWAVARTGAPVALAKCLASVAEWLTATPRITLATAMVERRGSPLTRRVRRILGRDRAARDPQGWRTLAVAAVALLALTAAAPRVSVPKIAHRDELAMWVGQLRTSGVAAATFTARIDARRNGAIRVVNEVREAGAGAGGPRYIVRQTMTEPRVAVGSMPNR